MVALRVAKNRSTVDAHCQSTGRNKNTVAQLPPRRQICIVLVVERVTKKNNAQIMVIPSIHRRFLLGSVLATLAAVTIAAKRGDSVTVGTLDMSGSTVSSGTVDGNAVVANSNAISGTLCNKTNTAISDITVTVKRAPNTAGATPTFNGVAFDNTTISSSTSPQPTQANDGYTQTLNFVSPIPNNGCKVFTISGITCATDLVCTFTPSHSNGAGAEATLMTRYEFRASTTSSTQATQMAHDRVAFEVTNLDNRREIIALSGQITFLDGSGPNVASAVLQNVQNGYSAVPGSTVSVSGNTFTITGFNPLDETGIYWVVVVFAANPPLEGRMQLQLSPTYDS